MGVSFAIPIDVALQRRGPAGQDRARDARPHRRHDPGRQRAAGRVLRARPPARRARPSVDKDGPAAKAGVTPGDVILNVGGQPIERFGELSGADRHHEAGGGREPARVARRQGTELQREASRSSRSSTPAAPVAAAASTQGAQRGSRQRPRADRAAAGAAGEGAAPGPPATRGRGGRGSRRRRRACEPGDIILGVNGKRVKDVKELQDAAKSSGKNVALLRSSARMPRSSVPLRLP